MKKFLLLFVALISLTGTAKAGDDTFMLTRNGESLQIKLERITPDKIYFINEKQKKKGIQIAPKDFVYMIKTEKKNTMFFDEEGNQTMTRKSIKVGKDDDVIYLMAGGELIAYNLEVSGENVRFKLEKKKKAPFQNYKKSEIFLIRHSDGYNEILAEPYVNKNEPEPQTITNGAPLKLSPAAAQPTTPAPQPAHSAPAPQPARVSVAVPAGAAVSAPAAQEEHTIPATNLTPQEIVNKVYEANPYTLFKKNAVAEYCFMNGEKEAKFMGVSTYVQQKVEDVKIENGLYVVYYKQYLLNSKHEPSKGIASLYKNALYPTEIDVNGTFHWTHDLWNDIYPIEKKRGYGALIKNDLDETKRLQTSTMLQYVRGDEIITYNYEDLRVLGRENVTTPCGTFDCLKIHGNITRKIKGEALVTYISTIWLARGIGVVRYDYKLKETDEPTIMYLNKLYNN